MQNVFFWGYLMVSLCVFSGTAQEGGGLWQETISAIAPDQVIQMILIESDTTKTIDKKNVDTILNSLKDLALLENPECRCLPTVEGRLLFLLSTNKILAIELVKAHWFQAVLLEEGKSTPFILKDKEDKFVTTLGKIMNPSTSSKKEKPIHEKCAQMMYPPAMGKCSSCSNPVRSVAYKYCESCARDKGVCMVCGEKLTK